MEADVTTLCRAIEDAFSNVESPGDSDLACGEPPEDPVKTRDLVRSYRGKHWKQILRRRNEWFRRHHEDLVGFSPRAFHFFLPAFLIQCVTRGDRLDLTLDWLVYAFISPRTRSLLPKYRANMAPLNARQTAVVMACFRFLKEKYRDETLFCRDVDKALLALRRK